MFDTESPETIIEICDSKWPEIVETLCGDPIETLSIGSIARNLAIGNVAPALDHVSISAVLATPGIKALEQDRSMVGASIAVIALVLLNVWQDQKSKNGGGRPIDGANNWISDRIFLGIPGPKLRTPIKSKSERVYVEPEVREDTVREEFASEDEEACHRNWEELCESLSTSDLRLFHIQDLANHLGFWWPRNRGDYRLCDFFEGHASTKDIWAMRSIGEKKAKTIFSILLEAWKFEQGDSDRIAGLNENPEIEELEVLTPMALLEGKWMEFCDAVLAGDSSQTSLEKHYEALGIKCTASLRALSVSDVIEAESLREFVASRKGIGKKKVDDLAIVLHRLWATIQPGGPAGFPPDPHEEAREIYDEMLGSSLEERIDKALEVAGVSPKTREIIDKRYGFSEGRPKILEELGAENGVTRERIRQLQAAGEKKAKGHAVSNAMIEQLCELSVESMLQGLKKRCRSELIRERRLKGVRLSPGQTFLIEMSFGGSLSSFLGAMVERNEVQLLEMGWWLGEELNATLLDKLGLVRNYLEDRVLPCPSAIVASEFGLSLEDSERLAIAVGFRCQFGLVFEKRLLAPQRRSVFSMNVAVVHGKTVWNEAELYERAVETGNRLASPFRLFQRDLGVIEGLIVDSPGPFAVLNPLCHELFSERLSFDGLERSEHMVNRVRASERERSDDDGLTECILDIIGTNQILKYEEIESRYLATGRESLGSVGPMMLTIPEIVRYAPGWWGRKGLSLSSEKVDALCNEADLRQYVEAKHGGGLLEMFCFWTAEMEYQWARWAEANAESILYESFLEMIEPDDWDLPEPIKKQWVQKKRQHGCYRFGVPAPDFSNGNAGFHTVYGLIALAVERGELGYAGVSNFMGWRFLNDRRAFSAIALLVSIGVLEPSEQCDVPHQVRDEAETMFKHLSRIVVERPEKVEAEWQEFLLGRLNGTEVEGDFGWINIEVFKKSASEWLAKSLLNEDLILV